MNFVPTLHKLKGFFMIVSLLLMMILLYWASTKKVVFKNLTEVRALSETTQSLLQKLTTPIIITLYNDDIDSHYQAKTLIERYQFIQPKIQFQWVPHRQHSVNQPSRALILSDGTHSQTLDLNKVTLDENQLTTALFKLQRQPNQWVVFLQGHDEPSPFEGKNTDFSLLRIALENQGLKVQQLNLALTPFIPDNTQVLVIASPKYPLLAQEEKLLTEYIQAGKDLLWLIDPNSSPPPRLSALFGVSPLPGTIVDLYGKKLGTPHPAITLIDHYLNLPFQAPKTLTAFPWAAALKHIPDDYWQHQPLLVTHEFTWTETSDLQGNISFDPETETSGPLSLGISLTHNFNENHQQRIAIIGNSHFLTNGTIENYGNLALGLNLFNWLSHDDRLISITQPVTQDVMLQVRVFTAVLIQYGYPLFAALILALSLLFYYLRVRTSNQQNRYTLK